jgi:hypothetical protein
LDGGIRLQRRERRRQSCRQIPAGHHRGGKLAGRVCDSGDHSGLAEQAGHEPARDRGERTADGWVGDQPGHRVAENRAGLSGRRPAAQQRCDRSRDLLADERPQHRVSGDSADHIGHRCA